MHEAEQSGLELVTKAVCFGGALETWEHQSEACQSKMRFSSWRPPGSADELLPWMMWLSGLTCNEDNFMMKAGAQRYAAEHGMALIVPDTSPRNTGIPGEDEDWDFGSGAGFYVNATQSPWASHYQMFDYVAEELPALVARGLHLDASRVAVSGHSMGGHGALILGLKRPEQFQSVSAFAPICSASRSPWGEKALSGYLGEDRSTWVDYDACELVAGASERRPLLVDQGGEDAFIQRELKPELLSEVCERYDHPLDLHVRPGYDHSYFFIASFIGNHIRYHARALGA